MTINKTTLLKAAAFAALPFADSEAQDVAAPIRPSELNGFTTEVVDSTSHNNEDVYEISTNDITRRSDEGARGVLSAGLGYSLDGAATQFNLFSTGERNVLDIDIGLNLNGASQLVDKIDVMFMNQMVGLYFKADNGVGSLGMGVGLSDNSGMHFIRGGSSHTTVNGQEAKGVQLGYSRIDAAEKGERLITNYKLLVDMFRSTQNGDTDFDALLRAEASIDYMMDSGITIGTEAELGIGTSGVTDKLDPYIGVRVGIPLGRG